MTDPRYDPAFQRGYDGQTPAAAPVPAPLTEPVTEPAAVTPAAPEPLIEPPEGPSRRVNPYSLTLLLVGVVAIATGAWLFHQVSVGAALALQPDAALYDLQILVQGLAPALMLGGVIAIVSWLVLGALTVRARGRR